MYQLTNVEKGALIKLFNRGGYVLDFSTVDFNAFTMDSIGVALCERYGVSKGKSLIFFVKEANEADSTKLLIDLFDYYELNLYPKEQATYQDLYCKCKQIIDKVRSSSNGIQVSIDNLKEVFSSDYINKFKFRKLVDTID